MRLYTIIESFGPDDGDKWTRYCEWRGLDFEGFDSIDGILRPNLFTPSDDMDWDHVVNEDFMIHFFTDLPYARQKHKSLGRGALVCFSFDSHDEGSPDFLGYDLIDPVCDVSLLTNWGNDKDIVNQAIGPRGLIRDFECISAIREHLLAAHPTDDHVKSCRIVSIYTTDHAGDCYFINEAFKVMPR